MCFFVGLDLGQAEDYTALAVAKRSGEPTRYDLRHLERFPLGTPYPAIVARVGVIISQPLLLKDVELVVDATGVGGPVVDLLARAGLDPLAVTITGGDTVTREWKRARVPKRDLVATIAVLLQSGRLRVASALPEAETLVRELLDFRVRIDLRTAHDSYGAWREGTHDDLVLAVALACWAGETAPVSLEFL